MKTVSGKRAVGVIRKPENVDDYLATVPLPARDTLTKLRQLIRAAAPEADEKISWRMPVYYQQGSLVGFAAFKNHCSLFVMSGSFLDGYREELSAYEMTKSAIHFPFGKPLPAALVKKIVKARLAENAENAGRKKQHR